MEMVLFLERAVNNPILDSDGVNTAAPKANVVKTRFVWAPSPDVALDLNAVAVDKVRGGGNSVADKAAVVVKVAINNREEAEQVLPPETTSILVTANEGDHVIVFVSYRNRFGVFSKARGYEIVASLQRTPDPIGQISVGSVVKGLTVLDS
jgi:hypothetical protein